jgi:type II secretory pathway component PulC
MMRRDRTRTMFVWLLGAAFIALVGVIYAEISVLLTNDDIASDDAAPPNRPEPISSPPFFAMPDRASLAVILERPVFSETRRPSGDPDGVQATPTDFTLAGVVISASERSALVKPGNGEMIQRLKEGDDIGGWILEEIALDRIKIRRGVVEAEMLIDYAAPAPLIPRTESRKQKSAANAAVQKPAKQIPTQPGDAEVEPEEEIQY